MTDDFNTEDYKRLSAYAWKVANGRLSVDDFEDAFMAILIDSLTASARLGAPLIALAVKNAARTRYYSVPEMRAERSAQDHHLGYPDTATGQDMDAVDIDDRLVHESRWLAKADFVREIELRDMIARLPIDQQRAFALCGEMGLTLQQGSELAGQSVPTMQRNLARARATLQAWVLAL